MSKVLAQGNYLILEKVDYEKEEGSRTVPAWSCTVMTISWE